MFIQSAKLLTLYTTTIKFRSFPLLQVGGGGSNLILKIIQVLDRSYQSWMLVVSLPIVVPSFVPVILTY